MTGKLKTARERIGGLDALRGIAALVVVFRHFYNIVPELDTNGHWLFEVTPFHHLIAGRHAVILFFVLSGFVLSIPYFNGYQQEYKKYIIRRICRIYVPFLIGICAAGLLWLIFANGNFWRAPHGGDWSYPVSVALFSSHLMMTGLVGTTVLNPPMWTLIMEMRVSFIFPGLVGLVRRFSYVALIAAVLIGYMASKLHVSLDGSDNFYVSKTLFGAVLLTIYYIQFFVIGVVLSYHAEAIKKLMTSLAKTFHILIIVVIIFIPVGLVTSKFILHDLWYAFSSSYLILSCISFATFNRFLSGNILAWLGRCPIVCT